MGTSRSPITRRSSLPFPHFLFPCISTCFSLHNKYVGIFLSDTENTATDSTDKTFMEAEKFMFLLWWRVYSGFGISIKLAYAANGLQVQYLAWQSGTHCHLLIVHEHQAHHLCTYLLCAQQSPGYAAPVPSAVHSYDQLCSSHQTVACSPLLGSSPPASG